MALGVARLARDQRHGGLAVYERKEARLLPPEKRLHNDAGARRAKGAPDQHALGGSLSLGDGGGHDHALASGEAVRLHTRTRERTA